MPEIGATGRLLPTPDAGSSLLETQERTFILPVASHGCLTFQRTECLRQSPPIHGFQAIDIAGWK